MWSDVVNDFSYLAIFAPESPGWVRGGVGVGQTQRLPSHRHLMQLSESYDDDCTVGRLVVHCPVAPRICFENLLHPPCNGRVTHCPLLSNELRPDSLPNVVSRALVDPLPEHAWYGTVHNLVKQILQVSCSPPPTSCAPGWQLQPCSDGTESQSSLRVRAWLP